MRPTGCQRSIEKGKEGTKRSRASKREPKETEREKKKEVGTERKRERERERERFPVELIMPLIVCGETGSDEAWAVTASPEQNTSCKSGPVFTKHFILPLSRLLSRAKGF